MVAVLTRPTLVLNRNWQPVGTATVSRSLTLVVSERAKIVDPTTFQQYTWSDWAALIPQADEPFVQAVRFRLRVPEVITLTGYDRVPTNVVTFSRRNIYKRDRFTCQYCGRQGRALGQEKHGSHTGHSGHVAHGGHTGHGDAASHHPPLTMEELTLDHVIPRSRGGTSTWENCVLACIDCNKRKANRTPAEAHMPLRKEPVRPTWRPLYARQDVRIESWSKFLSEAYWNVELEE